MMTSSREPDDRLRRALLDFSWGIWSELGISGWGRTHRAWAIDPEPIIAFTPLLVEHDARLRDEVIDWCSGNWRQISGARLRNILSANELASSEGWSQLAASVNEHAPGARWPFAATPLPIEPTGRSTLRPFDEPSMIYLRMRAIFGLSGRSEVLRSLLFDRGESTLGELASRTGYSKGNIAEACDTLTAAGLLHSEMVGNRLSYSLANRTRLSEFVGESAPIHVNWQALLRIVTAISGWDDSQRSMNEGAQVVESHRMFISISDDAHSIGLALPVRSEGHDFLPTWQAWTIDTMEKLARGRI